MIPPAAEILLCRLELRWVFTVPELTAEALSCTRIVTMSPTRRARRSEVRLENRELGFHKEPG